MDEALLRPYALYEAIAASLRERILAHELAPGCPLDEATLAQGYGVSRTPVREALKVLAHQGLLQIEPRRGCCVAAFSGADVAALLDVLEVLEGFALNEAALKEKEGAAPLSHEALLQSAGNRHACELVMLLREKLLLAGGPAYQRKEAALFSAIATALGEALARRDRAQAQHIWQGYAGERRQSLACPPARAGAAWPGPQSGPEGALNAAEEFVRR